MKTTASTAGALSAPTLPDDYTGLDAAAHEDGFVRQLPDGQSEAWIAIEGMVCAACGQTIEAALGALPGVATVRVALMTQRARVVWDAAATPVSELFRTIVRAGYTPFPADSVEFEMARRQSARVLLWRLLVAACVMMQVMMYAAPEYLMTPGEISPDVIRLLRWAQWLLTIPVMLFCAWPILKNALRSVRTRRIAMDVPAALGICLAFAASTEATFSGTGDVWFDSVTMFVFFLLLARWIEARARSRATLRLESLQRLLPKAIPRVVPEARDAAGAGGLDDVAAHAGRVEHVSPGQLRPGDIIRVEAGATFAADGYIVAGDTKADEALLTGESLPLDKPRGAHVRAGSINVLSDVLVRVEQTASESTLGQIRQLVDEAAGARPDWMRAADRWASIFLVGILIIAGAAWVGWHFIDPSRALGIAIAILIVTCPCALSLATPAAMLSATTALARHGIWLRVPGALERLANANRIAFDKTGTLTQGTPTLVNVEPLQAGIDRHVALQTAATLAAWSRHPLSRALVAAADAPPAAASQLTETAGSGITGNINEQTWRLGSLAFITPEAPAAAGGAQEQPNVWLANPAGPAAHFVFSDQLRHDAPAVTQALQDEGLQVALLSGDTPQAVVRIASQAGIVDARGGLSPAQKLDIVRAWQSQGDTVVMIGDGINDGPALAGADVSVALGDAAPLARSHADLVLASGRLADLPQARSMAQRAVYVMRQNLSWALAYNLVSVPLAMFGYMPPWAAAIGMALSSLLVIGNGMRLLRPAAAAGRLKRSGVSTPMSASAT